MSFRIGVNNFWHGTQARALQNIFFRSKMLDKLWKAVYYNIRLAAANQYFEAAS